MFYRVQVIQVRNEPFEIKRHCFMFMFGAVGFLHHQQEEFYVELELLREDSIEDNLVIEGEYLSEASMKDLWNWTE